MLRPSWNSIHRLALILPVCNFDCNVNEESAQDKGRGAQRKQEFLWSNACCAELCRKHEEEIRDTHAETNHINKIIAEKDAEMAELKRQAAQGRPPSAGASTSAKAVTTLSNPRASRDKTEEDDSPKSNMSSPWGTDVSLQALAFAISKLWLLPISRAGQVS